MSRILSARVITISKEKDAHRSGQKEERDTIIPHPRSDNYTISTTRCSQRVPTFFQPITQISQPELRTNPKTSDSIIFFFLALMLDALVACTPTVLFPSTATISTKPNKSLRMFAPGIHRSTTSATNPWSRKSFRVS